MAPFSICTKCRVRTRKVVKDPVTLKDIYVCPKCCKAKAEAQSTDKERPGKGESPPDTEPTKPAAVQVKPAAAIKLPLGPAAAATYNSSGRKCTPPIMQTVVINGRKYIAISATASDN